MISIIIKQTIEKYSYITNRIINNYNSYLVLYSQEVLLKYQLIELKNTLSIYVINTSILWGIDYFGKELFDKYINKKEKD